MHSLRMGPSIGFKRVYGAGSVKDSYTVPVRVLSFRAMGQGLMVRVKI